MSRRALGAARRARLVMVGGRPGGGAVMAARPQREAPCRVRPQLTHRAPFGPAAEAVEPPASHRVEGAFAIRRIRLSTCRAVADLRSGRSATADRRRTLAFPPGPSASLQRFGPKGIARTPLWHAPCPVPP